MLRPNQSIIEHMHHYTYHMLRPNYSAVGHVPRHNLDVKTVVSKKRYTFYDKRSFSLFLQKTIFLSFLCGNLLKNA